ncbi:hypothetical protein H0W26_05820, partial [Candidatus Dependentiae bacterium]|nr:hypothetical protein [Candidatus Dependentiae bacterium]
MKKYVALFIMTSVVLGLDAAQQDENMITLNEFLDLPEPKSFSSLLRDARSPKPSTQLATLRATLATSIGSNAINAINNSPLVTPVSTAHPVLATSSPLLSGKKDDGKDKPSQLGAAQTGELARQAISMIPPEVFPYLMSAGGGALGIAQAVLKKGHTSIEIASYYGAIDEMKAIELTNSFLEVDQTLIGMEGFFAQGGLRKNDSKSFATLLVDAYKGNKTKDTKETFSHLTTAQQALTKAQKDFIALHKELATAQVPLEKITKLLTPPQKESINLQILLFQVKQELREQRPFTNDYCPLEGLPERISFMVQVVEELPVLLLKARGAFKKVPEG